MQSWSDFLRCRSAHSEQRFWKKEIIADLFVGGGEARFVHLTRFLSETLFELDPLFSVNNQIGKLVTLKFFMFMLVGLYTGNSFHQLRGYGKCDAERLDDQLKAQCTAGYI